MKTMTCKQLGGACDKEFHAETLRQIRRRVKLAFRVQNRTLKGFLIIRAWQPGFR